jgi:SAM-dependent methyltransferase
MVRSLIDLLRRATRRVRVSRARRQSNTWLLRQARSVSGSVLSIGSGTDSDGQGRFYRDYFVSANSYLTSDVVPGCDLLLDVRQMPEVPTASVDCVFCSGVLEHVDDYQAALREITRVLVPGGVLLLGLPFRQRPHLEPHDYWRFTEHGIRHMLRGLYEIEELAGVDVGLRVFPASYWVSARKRPEA